MLVYDPIASRSHVAVLSVATSMAPTVPIVFLHAECSATCVFLKLESILVDGVAGFQPPYRLTALIGAFNTPDHSVSWTNKDSVKLEICTDALMAR